MSKQARKLRRIISVFLTAVMAVSCFSVSAAAACEESGADGALPPPTVRFADSQGWENVYIYAWDADGNSILGDWPGTQMYIDEINDIDEPMYTITLPYGSYNFLFNSGVDGEQTIDLNNADVDYYTTGKKDDNGHFVAYPYSFSEDCYQIRLINSRGWDDVYVYAWDNDGNELEGEWPGTKITSDSCDDFGNKRYKYNYRYPMEGVVFSNGKNEQTVDFTDLRNTFYYFDYYVTDITDESGHYLFGSLSDMDYHYGDIDNDGSITISDATDISFHLAQFEGSELSYLQNALADVDVDGTVSIADVTTIQFKLAELDDNSRTGEKCRLCGKGNDSLFLYSELDWENTYVYATDKEGNPLCGDWPGALLPERSKNWGYIFFSIPLETEKVVFSCGNKRTVEAAKFASTSNMYDMKIYDSQDDNGNYIAKMYYPYQKSQNSLVLFKESQGWENVNVYAWDENGNALLGDWPGTAMSYYGDNDFGEPFYSLIIPKEAVGIVFNSGEDGDLTEDVSADLIDYYDKFYTEGYRDELGHLFIYNYFW